MIVEFMDAWIRIFIAATLWVAVGAGVIALAVVGIARWLYGRLRASRTPQAPNHQHHALIRSVTKEKQPA